LGFVAFFVVELVMRIVYFAHFLPSLRRLPCEFVKDKWLVFDAVIVTAALAEVAVFNLIADGGSSVFGTLRLMKAIRLLRVANIFRMSRSLRTVMVTGSGALQDLSAAMLMLGLLLFASAILFVQLLGGAVKDNPGATIAAEVVDARFQSVLSSMLTLLQLLFLDGWSTHVVRPITQDLQQPFVVVCFVVYIFVVLVIWRNVVTGIFVSRFVHSYREEEREVLSSYLQDPNAGPMRLRRKLQKLDVYNHHSLKWHAGFEDGLIDAPEILTENGFTLQEVAAAFEIMELSSAEGAGYVGIDEFFFAVLHSREARDQGLSSLCKEYERVKLMLALSDLDDKLNSSVPAIQKGWSELFAHLSPTRRASRDSFRDQVVDAATSVPPAIDDMIKRIQHDATLQSKENIALVHQMEIVKQHGQVTERVNRFLAEMPEVKRQCEQNDTECLEQIRSLRDDILKTSEKMHEALKLLRAKGR